MTTPSEILTQEEIDALLAMLPTSGETLLAPAPPSDQQAAIRHYDFRRPDKFSKEQIRALRMMHENMGRRMAISLSAYLRTAVDANLADIDQGTYATFLSQLAGPAIYNIVSLKPLQGQMVLEISAPLADVIIDRLLGGPGRAWERHREFTDLELSLLEGVVVRILDSLAEAWTAVLPVKPQVEETLLNMYFVQLGLLTDAIVWIVFEVRLGEVNGYLRLGLPYALLKPVGAKLSPQAWIAGTEASDDLERTAEIQHLIAHLQEVPVEVTAILGEVDTTLQELNELKPGDLIPLDAAAHHEIKVLVGGVHRFWARPGTRGTRLAVEITQVITGEAERLEER
ncbi:MAG: flagellar motor switch protein FliM [Anaerolineae bacterium]|nr:flagellar motor switch protein FliM [Anaerolineae bacterium]MDW8099696.1 flagellar motor switch protein FliM [Anaerolineae bacterium]